MPEVVHLPGLACGPVFFQEKNLLLRFMELITFQVNLNIFTTVLWCDQN